MVESKNLDQVLKSQICGSIASDTESDDIDQVKEGQICRLGSSKLQSSMRQVK